MRLSSALLGMALYSSATLAAAADASTPLAGWTKSTVARPKAPALTVYTSRPAKERLPVLLMIQGSKCLPLFRFEDGRLRTPLFVTDPGFFAVHKAHALVVERRGIESFAPIPADIAAIDPRLRCSDTYGGLTKDTRVRDVVDAVRALRKEPWFGELLIIGHSEGVDVATGVAAELEEDAFAVGLLAGASPSMLVDHLVEARKSGDVEAVRGILDDMFYLTGKEVEGKFGGYPVRRVLSFAVASDALADSLRSSSPLFVANGTLDPKASVEAADMFVFDVLRKQPQRKLRYWNYAKLDHDFVDAEGKDHSESVFAAFVAWALSADKGRDFEVRP